MTPAAAESLAVRISQTWPKSPPVDVWAEDLAQLDEGTAGTAYARLRREIDGQALTIARFLAVARSLRITDGGTARPAPCARCDDTGWVEAPDRIEPGPTRRIPARLDPDGEVLEPARDERTEIRYTQMQPCTCREGRSRAETAVWLEHHPHRANVA